MSLAVIALIEGLIELGTNGLAAYQQLKPILLAGREPTPAEWTMLYAAVDAAHASVQAL